MILKMISYKAEDRISTIEICKNLIMANSFCLEEIEEKHFKTLVS